MAQSILNVNIQPGGNAIFKRDGYGLFQSLPISCSTCAVHGGYHFQQIGGNDVQLWANDVELSASVNDATFVRIATGTAGATWQCTDSQGKAYCFSSAADTPVQTDGTIANTVYFSSAPSGTMATFTPLQLVVAGVTGNVNTIYVSGQNAFNNFTIGILPSSPFTEPIASPGSRITHLAYYFGKLFWWKDQSFGYATFTNQNDWQLTIVSNQIGTLDNSDAFWNSSGFDAGTMFSGTAQASGNASPGGIFFRGQDNHIYVYDGYFLTRLSRIITPTVAAANKKKANLWTQTTQADFQSGSIVPTPNLSTIISPGDVIVSSFQAIEISSTQWVNGTNNNTSVFVSSIALSIVSGNLPNNSFESPGVGPTTNNWTTNMNPIYNWLYSTTFNPLCGSITAQDGSIFGRETVAGVATTLTVNLVLASNNSVVLSSLVPPNPNCSWTQNTITDIADTGKRVQLDWHFLEGGTNTGDIISDTFTFSGSISFYTNGGTVGGAINWAIDNVVGGSDTITSGTFTSQVYNTGFTSSTYQVPSFSYIANTTTPTFVIQTATSTTGTFSTLINNTTGSNLIGNQYARYIVTFPTLSYNDIPLSSFTGETILARSTGTYYSSVKNAPNLTSWGVVDIDDFYPGISSITYYTRSSTNSFSTLSSTPAWIAQTKNATVTASTGTFFQLRGDFYLSAATETPALNDFTFNWFEGIAGDKAYITYFNDAIWFSVSSGTSTSTNDLIFYWDLLNGAWTIYNIPANGFEIENNSLYFGDPVQGRIFKFGGVTTDNGLSINSYWRSKSFLGNQTSESSSNGQALQFAATDDLFVQKEFVQADFILGESSTTLSYIYTLDSKTSTVFTMTAFDSSASLIQRNFLLPIGKIGKYYDFQIGDNSSAPKWIFMGHRVIYNPLNWRPVLQ